MEYLKNFDPYNWIIENLSKIEDSYSVSWKKKNIGSDWHGEFVNHYIPGKFEAYCKICHPIYEDLHIQNKDINIQHLERTKKLYADWGEYRKEKIEFDRLAKEDPKAYKKLMKSKDLVRKKKPQKPTLTNAEIESIYQTLLIRKNCFVGNDVSVPHIKRLTWKDLAKIYNVAYHPEITLRSFSRLFSREVTVENWPLYLIPPKSGSLDSRISAELINILIEYTPDEDCYYYFDRMAKVSINESSLIKGSLKELNGKFSFNNINGSPNYWWPEDKSWCVVSHYKHPFTLVGGSRKIIDSILINEEIETFVVQEVMRVDPMADQLNV